MSIDEFPAVATLHPLPDPKLPRRRGKRQAELDKMRQKSEIEEERRLKGVKQCRKCKIRCSVCQARQKCCFDQPENKVPMSPIAAEKKQSPPPWEQGYAVGGTSGTGPEETEAWED